MQKISKLSVLLVALFTSQQSISGELFPFDPPKANSCKYTVQLSATSEDKISDFAEKVKKLSPEDKKQLIQNIAIRLKNSVLLDAASVGLTKETLYYAELLNQIDL